jgi:hypothetical protein
LEPVGARARSNTPKRKHACSSYRRSCPHPEGVTLPAAATAHTLLSREHGYTLLGASPLSLEEEQAAGPSAVAPSLSLPHESLSIPGVLSRARRGVPWVIFGSGGP